MSTARNPQLVDPQEFIPILDYAFLGDTDTVEKKTRFIEELRRESTVFHAALHSGVSRKTVYRWAEVDEGFASAWADALADATDVMEHSVYHQALNGDTLLKMFWLKKHRPEYRDKTTIDIQVVQSEISERMQALNLNQLPAMSPQFVEGAIDTGYSQNTEDSQPIAIPSPSLESAKRDE
jgi:hypothetical protein